MMPPISFETIEFLGDLAELSDDFHFLQVDACLNWIRSGCPYVACGADNGVYRFKIAHDLKSDRVFSPIVVREIRQLRPRGQDEWTRHGEYGHPNTVLALATTALIQKSEELKAHA